MSNVVGWFLVALIFAGCLAGLLKIASFLFRKKEKKEKEAPEDSESSEKDH